MARQKFTGSAGLPLPRRAVKVLKERGLFAHAMVSVEHQQLAQRYVVRGLESGGSAGDVGRYITFAGEQGEPLECLHPVEAIAVNGLHAVVISPVVVRVDMLRKGRTYELLITRHSLRSLVNGTRPQLETEVLFRGIHGVSNWIYAEEIRLRPAVLPLHSIRWPENPCRCQTNFCLQFRQRQKGSTAPVVLTPITCASHVRALP
jgi:hypothetical protein